MIYSKIKGKKTNLPSVVFISAENEYHWYWNTTHTGCRINIQNTISKYTQTFSYDAPQNVSLTYLFDDNFKPRTNIPKEDIHIFTMKHVVQELFCLLKNNKIKPPFILVGGSRGALFAQLFAKIYHKYVTGMLLIDPENLTIENYHINNSHPLVKYYEQNYIKQANEYYLKFFAVNKDKYGMLYFNEIASFLQNYNEFPNETYNYNNIDIIQLVNVVTNPKKRNEIIDKFYESLSRVYDYYENFKLNYHQTIKESNIGSELIYYENANNFIHFENPKLVINCILKLLHIHR